MQKLVITGGLGLLGKRVLRRVISDGWLGQRRVRVMIVDKGHDGLKLSGQPHLDEAELSVILGQSLMSNLEAVVKDRSAAASRARVSVVRGDLGSAQVSAAIKEFAAEGDVDDENVGDDVAGPSSWAAKPPSLSVFHLASVMSGQGEADFHEALRVNVDGTRSLLEVCREMGERPRFVFASSIAAFGGGSEVTDETKLVPDSTYGMTKACAELLVNDCTRKKFVDGRIARLPTVIVRPGPPNPAATGCFSSVPKAILHGHEFESPVSGDLRHPCIGLSSGVSGLIHLGSASENEIGKRRDRAVTLPSLSLTLQDIEQSALKIARKRGISPGKVSYSPDASTEVVVTAMPCAVHAHRAHALGLRPDESIDDIIHDYMREVEGS